jgi:hypothetical protein
MNRRGFLKLLTAAPAVVAVAPAVVNAAPSRPANVEAAVDSVGPGLARITDGWQPVKVLMNGSVVFRLDGPR